MTEPIQDGEIVISRIEIERLIADNTRLREALEYISRNTTHYMHEWVRNYARAALSRTPEDNEK